MNKIISLLMTVSVVFMFASSAVADLSDGLVTYYPFNGNANDESGNGNHGTVFGATLTEDRFGASNSAYSFDGNDFIKASASILPSTERTTSLWFKADRVDNEPCQLGYGGGGGGTSWFMCLNPSGRGSFHMSSHFESNKIDFFYDDDPVGEWFHFAVTTDTNGTKLYVNGLLKASNTTFVTNTIVAGKDLAIGVITSTRGTAPYTDGNVDYHQGEIDDIRIYNRAISASEVLQLFNESGGGPEITSPTPGSTLSGATETFTYTANGAAATEWWLWVGTSQGEKDIDNSGSLGTATSHTVNGLPTDGSTVHVRLWYRIGGSWSKKDFKYTAASGGDPTLTSPAPGSTLSGATETFTYTANGAAVTEWWLWVGTSPGTKDIDNSGSLGTATSHTVNGLPTDGSTVHVRLWYKIAGSWSKTDFTYPPSGEGPTLTSPIPCSITVFPQLFTWTANGAAVTEWWLWVGTSTGAKDIYNSGSLGTATSDTVNGLPTDGSTVHVRLWYKIAGSWSKKDFTYPPCVGGPTLTSPTPGSTLSGATETFTYTANGAAVTEWWLYVGTSTGAKDIHNSGSLGTATSHTVNGLPTDGSTVHVRLWYRIGGSWSKTDFTYTASTL